MDLEHEGCPAVLYRLPRLKDASVVRVVEGEKDVENLEVLGYAATCNAGGAGKWRTAFGKDLRGKRVVVIPDADEPGRKHAETVVQSLVENAAEIRVVHVKVRKDVSDWIANGATKEDIDAATSESKDWDPGEYGPPKPQQPYD